MISSKDSKPIWIAGLIFISAGVIFNEWTLAKLISSDGAISSMPAKIVIAVCELIFILLGIILMKYPSSVRAYRKDIVFAVIVFLFFLIILEGALRAVYYVKGRNVDLSEVIGWQAKEYHSWKKYYEGYGEVVFSTKKYGFRTFGRLDTDKIKILVLGDSYTEATTVSDGHPYYEYMKKNHDNIEIFAYGAGGFGSLQEYMIVDRYFDMIRPDVIVWQFCPNDLVNNNKEIESLSLYNNNHNTRPYYDYKNDRISMDYPQRFVGWADTAIQYSYLFKMLSLRLGILSGEVSSSSIERYLKEDDPLAIETIRTTSAIMRKVRKRAGDIPIVTFQTDNEQIEWSGKVFSEISKEHSMHYIHGVPEALLEARAGGTAVDGPGGSHWNEAGHSIVGKKILDYLVESNLLHK